MTTLARKSEGHIAMRLGDAGRETDKKRHWHVFMDGERSQMGLDEVEAGRPGRVHAKDGGWHEYREVRIESIEGYWRDCTACPPAATPLEDTKR